MNRNSRPRQLALFPAELPSWESLPQERQQALQEILSLLLEQVMRQQADPSIDIPQEQAREQNYV